MTTDYKRLGKRGSYRLGRLRAQGIRVAAPPGPFRPSFARSTRRGPASAWLAGLLLATAVIAGGTVIGWWFLPFVAGLACGLANRVAGWRSRVALGEPSVSVPSSTASMRSRRASLSAGSSTGLSAMSSALRAKA